MFQVMRRDVAKRTFGFSLLTGLAVLSLGQNARALATLDGPGRVVAVTVFQGQALVTREIMLPESAGLVEAIVTGLPERLLPGSLYAEPGQGVQVRSVRSRVRPVESDDRAEVRDLDAQLEKLQAARQALGRRQKLLSQRTAYLTRLEQFTADTARGDLSTGVLDAAALSGLTELVFTQREEIAEQETALLEEVQQLAKQIDLLQRQRQTLAQGANRSSREAVVFINKEKGAAAVRLMYLVSGATWSPSYNLRAKEDRSEVVVEYNASVTQMSGEDWADVEMILSTATPSLVATAPKLEPLDIRLISVKPKTLGRESKADLFNRQKALASNRGNAFFESSSAPSPGTVPEMSSDLGDGLQPARGRAGGFGGVYAQETESLSRLDTGLNRLACELQLFDLSGRGGRAAVASPIPNPAAEGISVVYRLANTTSLPSRSDKQLIQIAAMPIKADFYHVATPVLTEYVYEEAELVNDTQSVLLAGPAATFLGDRFVGRGQVPSVARGEAFTVGLGINESLRASRELVDKTDRVQGGNRIARFDYRLTIENFGDTEATVRLLDRLPKSDNDAIKVTLVTADPPMNSGDSTANEGPSASKTSHSKPTKEGFLEWQLVVRPGATESDATQVNYTVQIEHDKNLTLAGVPQ